MKAKLLAAVMLSNVILVGCGSSDSGDSVADQPVSTGGDSVIDIDAPEVGSWDGSLSEDGNMSASHAFTADSAGYYLLELVGPENTDFDLSVYDSSNIELFEGLSYDSDESALLLLEEGEGYEFIVSTFPGDYELKNEGDYSLTLTSASRGVLGLTGAQQIVAMTTEVNGGCGQEQAELNETYYRVIDLQDGYVAYIDSDAGDAQLLSAASHINASDSGFVYEMEVVETELGSAGDYTFTTTEVMTLLYNASTMTSGTVSGDRTYVEGSSDFSGACEFSFNGTFELLFSE